jgi:ketosteroid isomerase-like protein
MSQENVKLVRRLQPDGLDLVQVFSTGISELISEDEAELFADDFEVRVLFSDTAGIEDVARRGPGGLAEIWREWLTPWDSYRLDVEQFIDAGDAIVVLAHVVSRTKHDGVLMEHSPTAIWKIREGKIAAIHFYLEREEALKAVGLSEQDAHTES